jgi:hypothetical protein
MNKVLKSEQESWNNEQKLSDENERLRGTNLKRTDSIVSKFYKGTPEPDMTPGENKFSFDTGIRQSEEIGRNFVCYRLSGGIYRAAIMVKQFCRQNDIEHLGVYISRSYCCNNNFVDYRLPNMEGGNNKSDRSNE